MIGHMKGSYYLYTMGKHLVFRKTGENWFKKELARFKREIEKRLDVFFQKKMQEAVKMDKEYQDFVQVLFEYTMRKGAKRIRGTLACITYKMYGGIGRSILDIATALELVHSFLLIHDDWIDQDSKRRGGDTVHKVFEKRLRITDKQKREHTSGSCAVMLGDLASLYSSELVLKSGFANDVKVRVLKNIISNLSNTVYGEYLDILNFGDIGKIKRMIENKTAFYTFVNPLTVGAVCAGADRSEIKKLEDIGRNLGIAFQIRDDILDIFGENIGKDSASDIREGKVNLLTAYALKNLKGRDLTRFKNILFKKKHLNKHDIEFIKKSIETSGSLDYNVKEAFEHKEKAQHTISKLKVKNTKYLYFLLYLSEYVVTRKK